MLQERTYARLANGRRQAASSTTETRRSAIRPRSRITMRSCRRRRSRAALKPGRAQAVRSDREAVSVPFLSAGGVQGAYGLDGGRGGDVSRRRLRNSLSLGWKASCWISGRTAAKAKGEGKEAVREGRRRRRGRRELETDAAVLAGSRRSRSTARTWRRRRRKRSRRSLIPKARC